MIFEWAVQKRLFRNINHAIWFLMTLWLLIVITAYYYFPNSSYVLVLPLAIHFIAFIQALYTVIIKKQNSETISRDCIWYNGLMVLLYTIFFLIIPKLLHINA